jgi:hypothetical protein
VPCSQTPPESPAPSPCARPVRATVRHQVVDRHPVTSGKSARKSKMANTTSPPSFRAASDSSTTTGNRFNPFPPSLQQRRPIHHGYGVRERCPDNRGVADDQRRCARHHEQDGQHERQDENAKVRAIHGSAARWGILCARLFSGEKRSRAANYARAHVQGQGTVLRCSQERLEARSQPFPPTTSINLEAIRSIGRISTAAYNAAAAVGMP